MRSHSARAGYGNGIVKDALVMWLDPGNPTSYPGSGTTITDLSGNANNGTLTNGPTFSTNSGGVIVFDGTNDYIDVPNASSLNSNVGTVCFWVKRTNGARVAIVGKHSNDASTSGWGTFFGDSPYPFASSIKGGTWDVRTFPTTSASSQDTWYNVVLSFSSGVSHAFYVNNSEKSSGGCVSFSVTSQSLRIGSSPDSYWSYFKGEIGPVYLYKKVLTASEVSQNFNALRGRFGI